MTVLFRSCRLIPALSGGVSGLADVRTDGETITSVQPAVPHPDPAPADCRVIDCGGKTLLPGLLDIHTHMNWSYVNGEIRLDDFRVMLDTMKSARCYLDNGFTTIRDLGSGRRVALAVKKAVSQGLAAGPRILSAGVILSPASRDAVEPYHFLRQANGAEEFQRAAREELGAGADMVKLYADGNPSKLLPEEMAAAVRIARIYHKPVSVHAHSADAIRLCLDQSVDTIEHASYLTPEQIEQLKARDDVHIVPTLAVLSPKIPTPGFTPAMKEKLLKPLLEANAKNITAAYAAGLKLGFGTDCPIEDLDQAVGLEFYMRKTYCSMENVDMLLQATRHSAKIIGLGGVTGEIRKRLSADLILMDGDPDKDISVMYHKPLLVMARGEIFRNSLR